METLMIVEDETAIRKGLKAIVERSGIAVAEILECANGEEALAILSCQKVDVLITDIKMPKMDGIELARRLRELPEPPFVIAISGYDEFSYAVGMLREGICDYLLKPIDRNALLVLLTKLDQLLAERRIQREKRQEAASILARLLISQGGPSVQEQEAFQSQFGEALFGEPYRVACSAAPRPQYAEEKGIIPLGKINGYQTAITTENMSLEQSMEDCIGYSTIVNGLMMLAPAFAEAVAARKHAFIQGRSFYYQQSMLSACSDGEVSEQELTRIINLIGALDAAAACKSIGHLVLETQSGRLALDAFVEGMDRLYQGIAALAITETPAPPPVLQQHTILDFYRAVTGWVEETCRLIQARDEGQLQRKIMKAVAYLHAHFLHKVEMSDLSSYVGMNYSQFSQQFSLYTHKTFSQYLRDLKLEESKRLLRETDLPINLVAKQAGFQNEKHFMRIFKNEYAVSPGVYRKTVQRGGER